MKCFVEGLSLSGKWGDSGPVFFCPSSHTPISAYFVTYPSKTADGEKGRPLVLPLLLYSLVELFLIPVYHAFKKSSRCRFEHRED